MTKKISLSCYSDVFLKECLEKQDSMQEALRPFAGKRTASDLQVDL